MTDTKNQSQSGIHINGNFRQQFELFIGQNVVFWPCTQCLVALIQQLSQFFSVKVGQRFDDRIDSLVAGVELHVGQQLVRQTRT